MSEVTSTFLPLELLQIELQNSQGLLLLRQRARQIVAAIDLEQVAQSRLVASIAEAGDTILLNGGSACFRFVISPAEAPAGQQLLVQISPLSREEQGDIPGHRAEWCDAVRNRLSAFAAHIQEIDSSLLLTEPIPNSGAEERDLRELIQDLRSTCSPDPLKELQVQSQELLRALDELRKRESELSHINQELTETNSGVLALYDELETLHRVGMILAQRHNLHDLLQTITDATTELTGAEFGAFYYHESNDSSWRLNAFSGSQRTIFTQIRSRYPPGYFGDRDTSQTVSRIDDVDEVDGCHACRVWSDDLAIYRRVRSCLFVPVLMQNTELAGALVFGHSQPGAFTERSERIVSAIAVQAAVGIEKARLFYGLQSASEAKDRFLAMLSHELRTPLNPVLAILSSLSSDSKLPTEYREDVAVMRRNIELEARIIDDLLDFNRIIRGKLQLFRSPVDLHSLIRAVVRICEPDFADRRHRLEVHLEADRSHVSGDPARLQQVLWNVLKNAIKFTPDGGAITIRTFREEEVIAVAITDTGQGIDYDVLPLIFSAFDQGQLPPGGHGGLGLGLAIAKTFMDLHGGSIAAVSSGLGQGTTFTLRLPVLHEQETPTTTMPVFQWAEAASEARNARILLVEDHVDTLSTLTRLLTRVGHTVIGATDYDGAVASFSSHDFDIVISDLGLPDRSGLELVKALQQVRPVPAIALSGYGMEADVAEAHSAGFARHITKPVDFAILQATIRDLTGGSVDAPEV